MTIANGKIDAPTPTRPGVRVNISLLA